MYPARMLCCLAFWGLLAASFAYAHPGRTDSSGGHYNRSTGEYHYHNGGSKPKPSYSAPSTPSRSSSEAQPSYTAPSTNTATVKQPAPVSKKEEPAVVKDLEYYQQRIAIKENGDTHVLLSDGSFCDVMNDESAMSVVWASQWSEAIGSSLHCADLEEKTPVIYLVLRDQEDLKYLTQSQKLIKQYGLPIKVRVHQAE